MLLTTENQGSLPVGPADRATLDLLAAWVTAVQTDDPEELARREQEFERFKQNMNQNRIYSESVNARLPFP